MKVFEFTDGTETDWLAAPDEEDAVTFYAGHIGDCEENIRADYKITEVPAEKWPEMTLIDPDEYDEETGEYKALGTFADWMKGHTVGCDIIATTSY